MLAFCHVCIKIKCSGTFDTPMMPLLIPFPPATFSRSDGYPELGVQFKLPSCLCPVGAAYCWLACDHEVSVSSAYSVPSAWSHDFVYAVLIYN